MQQIAFDPANAGGGAGAVAAKSCRLCALFLMGSPDRSSSVGQGAEAHAEPYIGRTPNLRGRLARFSSPRPNIRGGYSWPAGAAHRSGG